MASPSPLTFLASRFGPNATPASVREEITAIQHARGINTCVRCRSAYLPSAAGACSIHPQPLDGSSRYPCCGGECSSKGCVIAPHLPAYESAGGVVDSTRRIEYQLTDSMLRVGRYMSARVEAGELQRVEEEKKEAPSPSPSSASAAPFASVSSAAAAASVASVPHSLPQPLATLGSPVPRVGDEIVVCGQMYHTGTPVILWSDVGGYDHYRVERRFCPFDEASWPTTQAENPETMTSPNRFGLRKNGLTPEEIERVRGGQWDLPTLQKQIRQFVLHFDEAGLSQQCFRILQDERDLSIHFMLDIDGTIYQALDLKERAWQATTSNTCSVGCEIANIGAYDPTQPNPLGDWYSTNAAGQTTITIPAAFGSGGVHTPNFVGSPARAQPITGVIQGQNLIQYDYTPQQYAALTNLLATFTSIFPAVPLAYPVDGGGNLIREKLPDAVLESYSGILGHYHIQTNKVDPGPAMQWPVIIEGAKSIIEASKRVKEQALASASVAAPAPLASVEQIALRRLESRLLAAAESHASAQLRQGDPFFCVEAGWWSRQKAWLDGRDLAAQRPGPVTNSLLLQADERTPVAGLSYPRDYRAVSEPVWDALIELCGAAIPIVRASTDIYRRQPLVPVAHSVAAARGDGAFPASASAAAAYSAVVSEAEDSEWTMIIATNRK